VAPASLGIVGAEMSGVSAFQKDAVTMLERKEKLSSG